MSNPDDEHDAKAAAPGAHAADNSVLDTTDSVTDRSETIAIEDNEKTQEPDDDVSDRGITEGREEGREEGHEPHDETGRGKDHEAGSLQPGAKAINHSRRSFLGFFKSSRRRKQSRVMPAEPSTIDAPSQGAEDNEIGAAAGTMEQAAAQLRERLDYDNLPPQSKAHVDHMIRDPALLAGVAALGGVALFHSENARAFPGAGAIAAAILNVIKPLFMSIASNIMGTITSVFDIGTDKVATSVGMAGQAIQETMKDVHDQETVQDARPTAKACVTDGASKSVVFSREYAHAVGRSQATIQTRDYMQNSQAALAVAHVEMRERITDFPEDEDTNVNSLLTTAGYKPDAKKAAYSYIKRVRGPLVIDTISLNEDQQKTMTGAIFQVHKTSLMARQSTANAILTDMASRRERHTGLASAMQSALSAETDPTAWEQNKLDELIDGTGGLSANDMMQFEVERRYANPEWRAVIGDQISPVPVMKEIANMLAFQNYMLYEQMRRDEMALANDASRTITSLIPANNEATRAYGSPIA